jgi:hypothetical protein
MDLDHGQRCKLVTDAVDIVSDRYRWWRFSKLHWIARENMGDIHLTGRAQKNTRVSSVFLKMNHLLLLLIQNTLQ